MALLKRFVAGSNRETSAAAPASRVEHHRSSSLGQLLREDHEALAEALGALATSLVHVGSELDTLRTSGLHGVLEFGRFFEERMLLHFAREERVLAPKLRRSAPTLVGEIERIMNEHALLEASVSKLRRAAVRALAGERRFDRFVVSLGQRAGSDLNCHVCREEALLLDAADALLGWRDADAATSAKAVED